MDITTILNRKGSTAAAADAQLQRHLAQTIQLASRTPPDMGSEHGTSQPGDPTLLSYPSNPPSLHPMANMPPGVRYASPPRPGNGMPMMPSAYLPPGFPGNPPLPSSTGRSGGEPAPRIFHCSTCNKGFARRSDLARHGQYLFGQAMIVAPVRPF
jgi:hypothetical protein